MIIVIRILQGILAAAIFAAIYKIATLPLGDHFGGLMSFIFMAVFLAFIFFGEWQINEFRRLKALDERARRIKEANDLWRNKKALDPRDIHWHD